MEETCHKCNRPGLATLVCGKPTCLVCFVKMVNDGDPEFLRELVRQRLMEDFVITAALRAMRVPVEDKVFRLSEALRGAADDVLRECRKLMS